MEERRRRLEGKVAIVTGAGESAQLPRVGTGKAMSILFAREGAKVLLVDRVRPQAEVTLSAIQEEGGQASVYEGDVTSSADCRGMVEAAVERYGGLNILVNNVGIFLNPSTVIDEPEEQWDRVMNVNFKSMMLTSKHAIPRMIEGGGGSIINISSNGGLRGNMKGGRLSYNVSKGAVITLTTMMAGQHGRDQIRVNCIAPGSINTPMLANEAGSVGVLSAPLGTVGTAWDVAWAAVYLASDESRWVTGIVLPVDAGSLVMSPAGARQALEESGPIS